MENKVLEIRDSMTFIPVLATAMIPTSYEEAYYLARAGFGEYRMIMVSRLNDSETKIDPYSWSNNRTMHEAHKHIQANWDVLQTGDVVDVQYLLGERSEPKRSERFT